MVSCFVNLHMHVHKYSQPSEKSPHARKRRSTAECWVFNKTWTTKYLLTVVCLVCGEQISMFKDYNMHHHYETKHVEKYKNPTDVERARSSEALITKMQGSLTKLHTFRDAAAKTHIILQNLPKQQVILCFVDSAVLIQPETKKHSRTCPSRDKP